MHWYYYGEWTPLHFAVRYNHTEAVRLLIHAGVNKDLKNKDGKTALELAYSNPNSFTATSPLIIKLLKLMGDQNMPLFSRVWLEILMR